MSSFDKYIKNLYKKTSKQFENPFIIPLLIISLILIILANYKLSKEIFYRLEYIGSLEEIESFKIGGQSYLDYAEVPQEYKSSDIKLNTQNGNTPIQNFIKGVNKVLKNTTKQATEVADAAVEFMF